MAEVEQHSSAFPESLAEVSERLRVAEATRVPVPPPSRDAPLTLQDAYAVQRDNVRFRVSRGGRIVGRKVGLTSKAMQDQLGVDQPDFGVLFADMVVPDGGVIDAGTLLQPRVEAEFAFRLGSDLEGHVDERDAADAVSEVMLALEVIDSRVEDWRISLADTIADNASSALAVFAEPNEAVPGLLAELPDRVVTLYANGRPAASGPGRAILGDPLTALVWLTGALAGFGEGLRAGDLVLAGAVHASIPLDPHRTFDVTCAGFPELSVRVTGGSRHELPGVPSTTKTKHERGEA